MLCQLIDPEIILRTLEELEKENERYKGFAFSTRQYFFADALMPIYENISAVGNKLAFELFTPLKNSIRRADEFSSKLPVTDLYGAPLRGTDSNLHWYKNKNKNGFYISMDINNFKLINLINHEEGDKAIKRIGYLLRKCTTHLTRSKLFRSGGDEFVFFSENKEDIYLFINKVIEELDILELIDNKIKVTLSFGIGKSYVDADNALLLAKKRKAEITYPIHDLLE